jgi:hypothetical protein
MTDDNGNDRSTPAEPGDTPEWVPTPDLPWRPLPDDGEDVPFIYDYGMDWRTDRLGHPHFQDDGYPSFHHHRTECQSYGGAFAGRFGDDKGGLDGPDGTLSVYLVRPFRFGQWVRMVDEDRLALEVAPLDDDGQPFRFSIPASVIRNLAAHLAQTAGVADGWRPPRHVRESMTD